MGPRRQIYSNGRLRPGSCTSRCTRAAMISVRTRLILTGALTLLAAFAANCAHAGFSRPKVIYPAGGEGATFIWVAEACEGQSSLDGAGPVLPSTPLPPSDRNDPSDPPAFCPVEGMPAGGMGASGTASSPQSTGGGSSGPAIFNASLFFPGISLQGHLPREGRLILPTGILPKLLRPV